MSAKDKTIINRLLRKGYLVVIRSLTGKTFTKRYDVFQKTCSDQLKWVVIDDEGTVISLQG